ncbi:MAG: hypothetical protein SF051_14580 [Elusimicrobiota bacterium]|nr:hypothetical protein [Elusimicrobiota bacterium]
MKNLLALSVFLAAAPAAAQEVWKWQVTARAEASGRRPVSEAGRDLGGLGVWSTEQSLRRRFKTTDSVFVLAGASFERVGLSRPASAPLPDHLQAVAARLGAEWLIDSRSWAFVDAAPGLYGDERLSGRAANLPVAVQYNRLLRPGLRVLGGLSVDPFRKAKVLPFGGAAWRLTPRWNLRLLLPEPRVEYRAVWDEAQTVDLFAGLSLSGGQYRVAEDLGTRRGRPEVNGQTLSYNATRVLGGARWMRGDFEAEIAAGWAAARRFRYEPSGVELKSDGAPFGGLSVSARL